MARTKQFERDRVLEGAMHEFWSKGYHATSIPRLESAMGISRQSIYDTFKSKQSLFLQVLIHYQTHVIEKNLAVFQSAESPKQAICNYFAARAEEALKENSIKGCLITNSIAELAQHNQAVRKQTNITLKYMKSVFQEAINKSKQLEEIPDHLNADSVADFLVNCAQGLFILSRMNATKSSVDGVVKQIESTLT